MNIPIPPLPVALPPNATLTLTKQSSVITVDPETGNEVPSQVSITVKASLVDAGDKGDIQNLPGVDIIDVWLVGYIIEPKKLPAGYQLAGTVPMQLKRFDYTEIGEFTFFSWQSPFQESITQLAGTPCYGRFRSRSRSL